MYKSEQIKLKSSSKSKQAVQTLGTYFKKIDAYGRSAHLTFQGDLITRSYFGALVTLGLTVGIIIYAAATFFPVLRRESPTVTRQVYRQNLADAGSYPLYDLGFDLAFGLSTDYDETYVTYKIKNFTRGETKTKDVDGVELIRRYKETINIPFSKCNASNFNYSNWTEAELMGIGNSMCTDEKVQGVEGNYFNTNFTYLGFYLSRCKNSSKSDIICKSDKEIDQYLDTGIYLNIAIVNNYFDFKDYEKPIKQYIDNTISLQTQSKYPQKINIFVQKNSAQLSDDPWGYSASQTVEYPTFENYFAYEGSKDSNEIIIAFLRFDSSYETYTRDVKTVFNWLGNVGGLQGILFIIGSVVVNYISLRLFDAQIMKRLYLVERSKFSGNSQQVRNALSSVRSKLEDNSLKSIHEVIQNRKKLNFSLLQTFDIFALCRGRQHQGRISRLRFRQAQKRLASDLDIVKLLKSVRYIDIFKRLLLSSHQQLLLKFTRQRLIDYGGGEGQLLKKRKSLTNLDPDSILKELENFKKKKLKGMDLKVLKQLVESSENEEKESASQSQIGKSTDQMIQPQSQKRKKSGKTRKQPLSSQIERQNSNSKVGDRSLNFQDYFQDSKRAINLSSDD